MANALSTLRLLAVIPFAFVMASADLRSARLAALLMIVAIATDLADGPIARRTGTASAFGGTLDHVSDFLFVVCGLYAGASRGAFPLLLPVLISLAFAQYFIDSYWIHRGRALRGSKLGRYNGILYFVPLCGDILVRLEVGLQPLRPVVTLVAWALVLTTLTSMSQRFIAARKVPESPAAETAGQSPR